jgi:hypothetical protein
MPQTPQPRGALEFRRYLEEKGLTEAGKILNPACTTDEEAQPLIRLYVQGLLMENKTVSAGVVLWGESVFNPRPRVVQRVWRGLNTHQKIIIPGGAAEGKTYTAVCWLALRWWQDPEGTTIKLISTTGRHTESNIMGTMKRLFEATCVKMPGVLGSDQIAFHEGDKRAGLQIVRIRQGEDNSEVLQGFHPLPRIGAPHPLFGATTSVIAALDECEGIPGGVWTGVANAEAAGDKDHVKVMAFFNPKDITAPPARFAEPPGGWGEFDVETGVRGSDEWISTQGWYVIRLDPKKTENVEQRREVYPGFQTYEANRGYEERDGGNSQHAYVFGRGCYPPDSALNTVTPQRVLSAMRGDFIFSGPTTTVGAVDVAIDGRDDAVFSVGRFGMARAFNGSKRGPDGELIRQLTTFKRERLVAQLDQQFVVKKGSTEIVATACKTHCLQLRISPEWFMVDATGNGEPVYILLHTETFWSPKVSGIRFGDDATDLRILEEDRLTAAQQFDGLTSEVLFAITRWGEFGYLAISPTAASAELERELVGRRYKLGAGETLKVEDKKEYKKRLSRSPDFADSFSIWLHKIRTGQHGKAPKAAMLGDARRVDRGVQFDPSDVDNVRWLPSEMGI